MSNLAVNASNFNSLSELHAQEGNFKVEHTNVSGVALSTTKDVSSILSDCAEEAGFARNNFKEQKLFAKKSAAKEHNHLDRVRQALKILGKEGDDKALNNKHASLGKLLAQGQIKNFEELMAAIKQNSTSSLQGEQDDDELLQRNCVEVYLLLRQEIARSDDISTQQHLINLSDQLYQEHQVAIDACLSALAEHESSSFSQAPATDINQYSLGLNTALAFSYICTSLNSVDDMMRYLESKFASGVSSNALDTMLKTISSGLSEITPFSDKESLRALGSNLSAVQQIRSALGHSQDFFARLANILQGATIAATGQSYEFKGLGDGKDFVSRLMQTANRTIISAQDARALCREIEPLDCTSEVLLSQNLLSFERSLDDKLFNSLECRNRLMAATQELIDQAIDAEDEYLATLEEEDY